MNYITRTIRITFGLILFALGSYLSIHANIGLSPWDAFSIGFANIIPFSYGDIVVISGFVILFIDVVLKEKIGFGSLLNILIIGKLVDLFNYLNVIPTLNNFMLGILLLLFAQVLICFGTYYYIGGAMGCGPRDALMTALQKRLPNTPVGIIRGLIEGGALLIGLLLGAKVGLGTIISIFGISIIMQMIFKLLKFDIKAINHESMIDTYHHLTYQPSLDQS